MAQQLIFISSVQKELQEERFAVREYIRKDPLLQKHFDVFLFEELPAKDRKPDDMYLEVIDTSSIYLGLIGNKYDGSENGTEISPTEQEFNRATEKSKYRIILVKGNDDSLRHPKIKELLRRAQSGLIRRRFNGTTDLLAQLYASLIDYMEQKGIISSDPFDAAFHPTATLDDISSEKISWFLKKAREERNYSLAVDSSVETTLRHLNLSDGKRIKNSALLLFGNKPHDFFIQSEVKCLHFHGTAVQKPIPSYQIFKGTVFDQIDAAVDFVLSKLNRSVIPRNDSPSSDVEYEIPYRVVREAVVNAVAHRDYTSNAAVQVSVFADRVEVRNPGSLPNGFTVETLRTHHNSVPRNPLVADPLYLTRYVEKAGTGTLDMIDLSAKAELPQPDFQQQELDFVTILWRDWLTQDVLAALTLNDRQKKALEYIKISKKISNAEYQKQTGATVRTASRDLEDLVNQQILEKKGSTGRNAHYILKKKQDINRTNRTLTKTEAITKHATNTTNAPSKKRKTKGSHTAQRAQLKTEKTKGAVKVPNVPLSKGDNKGTKGTGKKRKKNGTIMGHLKHTKSRKK